MQAPMQSVDWRRHGGGCESGYLNTASRSVDFCGFFDFAERTSEESLHSVGNASGFFSDDHKMSEAAKLEAHAFDLDKSDFYTDHSGADMFDMSSFFREHDSLRMDGDDIQNLTEFEQGLIDATDCHTLEKEAIHMNDQQNESTDTVENVMDVPDSVDSIVMGIPYYVACQWQQMQQQQQQQQQAVMMLWWQAYLSGAYNMCGPKGMTATTQLGWSLPSTGLAAFNGAYANFGDDAFYQQMLMVDDKGRTTNGIPKRRRKNDPNNNDPNSNKKGRRQRHDERTCKNCGTNETPFWRKDKQDGHPLCNACGLYLSKNDAPRPKVLWKSAEKPAAPAAVPSVTPTAPLIV